MSQGLREDIRVSLDFLPFHRKNSNARRQSLNLDQLLEESRSQSSLSSNALDLILMSYRYHHAFEDFLPQFSDKKIKPEELRDLWSLGFAALLTRTQTPVEILVNDLVAISKDKFGKQTGGLSNAFFRKVEREKSTILSRLSQNLEILLGPELRKRWQKDSELKIQAAQKVFERPSSGIECFNEKAEFGTLSSSEFHSRIKTEKLQAINSGSWAYLKWIEEKIQSLLDQSSSKSESPASREIRVLDICAAPGGKAIGLSTLLKAKNKKVSLFCSDVKFARLELLKNNLKKWDLLEAANIELIDWTEVSEEALVKIKNFAPNIILADLPCTGLGTLHTRPDLLLENIGERILGLKLTQEKILNSLLNLKGSLSAELFVSICSLDPIEIGNISNSLKKEAEFNSFLKSEFSEGIIGWSLHL